MLWIAPTTRFAPELKEFYAKKTNVLDLKMLVNFSNSTANVAHEDRPSSDGSIDFPNIDWSERKTEASLDSENGIIKGCNFSGVADDISFGEWDLPWLTGCVEDVDGIHMLSLDHVEKKEVHPITDANLPSSLEPRETTVMEPSLNHHLDEFYFPEIDSIVEGALSNASDPSSIGRMEYRNRTKAVNLSSAFSLFPKNTWAMPVPLHDPVGAIANPVLTFPFELDPFQKQSIYHLEQGHSIFVAAHTSAGKTIVAEYAASLALSKFSKAIYTSPIKALSNQKYREFSRRFCNVDLKKSSMGNDTIAPNDLIGDLDNMALGSLNQAKISSSDAPSSRKKNIATSVGLLTGDMQVNPHASLLVMTTEILRSMLYRNSPLLFDLSCVIFDEVHYMNDSERGVVWEETLILLPPTVQLVLLSATLPNAMELADWLGRTRGQPIWVITTPQRPVPLEHYLLPMPVPTGGVPNLVPLSVPLNKEPFFNTNPKSTTGTKSFVTPTVQPASQKQPLKKDPLLCGIKNTPVGSRGIFTPYHSRSVLNFLQRSSLLPAILFIFSRKRCEEALDSLLTVRVSLLSKGEESFVHRFLNQRVLSLLSAKEDERSLPQVLGTIAVLKMGIAAHHSGLLPVLKEAIEILFSLGIIKLLVATETFAMGINMPARCVIFGELQKPDGGGIAAGMGGRRLLTPGEYTQMAGRAGRRGLDERGLVFICHDQGSGQDVLAFKTTCKQLIEGKGQPLRSQFRLTYNTILQLVRRPNLQHHSHKHQENGVIDMSDLIRKSFFENATQRSLPTQAASLRQLEMELEDISIPNCPYGCDEERMQNMRKQIFDAREKVSIASLVPGRRVASISETTEFLQPGLIISDAKLGYDIRLGPHNGGKIIAGTNAKGVIPLLQVLLFPITKEQYPWKGELERPINPDDLNSISVQFIPANELIPVGGKRLILIENYSSKTMTFGPSDYRNLLGAVLALQLEEEDHSNNLPLRVLNSSRDSINTPGGGILNDHTLSRCPDLTDHWAIFHRIHQCRQKIEALQWSLSGESLSLLPEYKSRLRVLELCGFIQQDALITLKGRIACEVVCFLFDVISLYVFASLFLDVFEFHHNW